MSPERWFRAVARSDSSFSQPRSDSSAMMTAYSPKYAPALSWPFSAFLWFARTLPLVRSRHRFSRNGRYTCDFLFGKIIIRLSFLVWEKPIYFKKKLRFFRYSRHETSDRRMYAAAMARASQTHQNIKKTRK